MIWTSSTLAAHPLESSTRTSACARSDLLVNEATNLIHLDSQHSQHSSQSDPVDAKAEPQVTNTMSRIFMMITFIMSNKQYSVLIAKSLVADRTTRLSILMNSGEHIRHGSHGT
jgi:hypothetical protein